MQRRVFVLAIVGLTVGGIAAGLLPARASGAIRVGVGKADITWRFGSPLVPNPNVFGTLHSRAWAKAIAIEGPEGRFVMARTDMLLITGDMHEAVAQRVQRYGIDAEHLFLSSTHTHVTNNGLFPHPAHGAFYKSFDPREYAAIADRVADAIGEAIVNLRPATLGSGTGYVTLPAVNRRYTDRESVGAEPFGNDPARLDPRLGLLRFDDARTGEPIAVAMNYGLHPVVLIDKNAISADYVGWVEHKVERALAGDDGGPMALWFTGAEGDQDPVYVRYSWPEAEWTGDTFAREALRVAAGIETAPITRAAIAGKIIPVPGPGEPTASWQPAGPRTPVVGPASLLIPSSIRLEAIELTTRATSTMLMGWPGEPIRDLGVGLKDMARASGFDNAWVIGLANDWSGYYVTPEEYDRGRYEATTFNFYGRESGTYVQYHIADLARALATRTPPETVPLTPQAIIDRIVMGTVATGAMVASGRLASAAVALPDAVPAIVTQPGDVTRMSRTVIDWIGGSPEVARGWIPAVQIQRQTGPDSWVTEVREGTGEFVLEHVEQEPGSHLWRATWETLATTPAGTYRVLIDGRRQDQTLADVPFTLASEPFEVTACSCLTPGLVTIEDETVSVTATYPAVADAFRWHADRVSSGTAVFKVLVGDTVTDTVTGSFVSHIEPVQRTIIVRDLSGKDLPVTIREPTDMGAFEFTFPGASTKTFELVSITDAFGNTTG